MATEILTRKDLTQFKKELMLEISGKFAELSLQINETKLVKTHNTWLKSYQVLKMLDMSKTKLHSLRISGKLPYSRIGHCIYFKYEDIMQLMEENKIKNPAVAGIKGRNRFSQPLIK